MLNKKVFFSILTIISISSTAMCSAHAKDRGVYVGGGIGYGQTALARPPQISRFERDGYTWSTLAGYQFNHVFSVETGYFRMDNVHAAGTIGGVIVIDKVEPSFTYLALKGRYPVFKSINIFAKFGGAYSYGREKLQIAGQNTVRSKGKVVPYLSAGVEYDVSRRVTLSCGVSNTFKTGQIPRLTAVSVGLQYLLVRVDK